MKPTKSLKIFQLFLVKSQLPYEMIFLLNKSMKMVSVELAEYYSKDQSDIDLDTIIPYLLLVIIQGVTEVN
jgi:hypothetical protein